MKVNGRRWPGTVVGPVVGMLALLAGDPAVWAQSGARWLTGRELAQKLAQPANYSSQVPFRRSLVTFCRAQGVAILIDRRVDPDQTLEVAFQNTPVEQILRDVAQSRGLGISRVGPVVYLGPAEAAARLRTLVAMARDQIPHIPPAQGRKLLRTMPLFWEDFAMPRDLLSQLAEENGLALMGLEQVPHDLWAEADLPPLGLIERLTLVAAQFDLAVQLSADGTAITLAPLPEEVAIVRSYSGRGRPEELAAEWALLIPDSRIKVVDDKVYVKGSLEDHDRISGVERPSPRPAPPPIPPGGSIEDIRVDSATVSDAPLEDVLTHFAGQLNLQVKIDHKAVARAGISLDQLVSFEVKDGTVADLFNAFLKPAGLTYRVVGNTLEIRPAR